MLIANANYKDAATVERERTRGEQVLVEADDNAVMARLEAELECYDPKAHGGRRLDCWLLLAETTSLWLLQTRGLADRLSQRGDIMATTMDDLLAKCLLSGLVSHFPTLDREPLRYESDSTVHLVLFGATPLTEMLAINAALTAHYPNYCRNTELRTRITVIDDEVLDFRRRMMARYSSLFDHSYHRTIDLTDAEPDCILHRPLYEGKRKDFIDVEWEFVRGNTSSDAVRQKLTEWAASERQQLTVTLSHTDETRNTMEAFSLPAGLKSNKIPVLCFSGQRALLESTGSLDNVCRFSYDDADMGCLRRLKGLAMRVNYVYNHCFALGPDEPVAAPADIDFELMERQWAELGSFSKQYSNIYNAMSIPTKMRQAAIKSDDWQAYYALSKEEIEQLAEVEHNRWSVEELILGYRPVTDEEQTEVERDIKLKKELRQRKIHYDLRAFVDLRTDATGKNVGIYDMALTQGIPLIIKTCIID